MFRSGGFTENIINKYRPKINSLDSQNIYRVLPKNTVEWNLIRYWELLNSLIELAEKCYFTLKFETHLLCFSFLIKLARDTKVITENVFNEISPHDFTNFFRSSFIFYETTKKALNTNDVKIFYILSLK